MNELEDICNITKSQRYLLKNRITERITKHKLKTFTGAGIPFYGEDITSEVMTVLTKKQFYLYKSKKKERNWLEQKAHGYLYEYFRKGKSNFELDSIQLKEIFDR